LIVASSGARDGVVVGHVPGDKIRTSSAMLRELVEFNRRIEIWQDGQDPRGVADAEICKYVEWHASKQKQMNDYLNAQRNADQIVPRAFEHWNATRSLPCFEESQSQRKGLIFVGIPASATDSGVFVTRRIARNAAKKLGYEGLCSSRTGNHSRADGFGVVPWDVQHSFAWSIVREPTSRAIDDYFQFISRNEDAESNFQTFRRFFRNATGAVSFYVRSLSTSLVSDRTYEIEDVRSILRSYDFLGVAEREDESIVALQLILNLETSDVLYLSSEVSCCGATLNSTERSLPLKADEYLASSEYKERVYMDEIFYQKVNQSLDLTIENFGTTFDRALAKFREAKMEIDAACTSQPPCESSAAVSTDTNQCIDSAIEGARRIRIRNR